VAVAAGLSLLPGVAWAQPSETDEPPAVAWAQPSETDELPEVVWAEPSDVDELASEADEPERDEPLQEIPETEVIGRPDAFPVRPLGEDTLVTPTRTEMLLSESGSSVTVITQEQITESEQTEVLEVLRGVEGLNVVQQAGPGSATSVFMRGANSAHTKVLLDGIPINDPSSASRGFDFSHLTVDNIQRIEVLRGPQSILYGSDAMGGVINIITKRGEGPLAVSVSGMGGSLGTHAESLHVGGGNDRCYYSFSGSYFDTDGISSAAGSRGNLERDAYRNAAFSGRFGWTPCPLFNVDYVFRYSDTFVEVDDFDYFVTRLPMDEVGPNRTNLSEWFFNRVQAQSFWLDGLVEQRIGFNLVDYDRVSVNIPFVPAFEGQTRQFDWQGNLVLTENNTFTAGVDYLHEEASTTFEAERSQNLLGVYLQDQFSLWDRSFTTVGVRWDDHSAAGPVNTYRVTTLYKVLETGGAFHGSLGTGFRAPALAENSPVAFGANPNLRPERSKGWDAGVRQEFLCGRLLVDATYFYNDFVDLIDWDPSIPPWGGLANVQFARTEGVELTGRWTVNPSWMIDATYTRTDTVDLSQNQPLNRRPRNKATLSIHHTSCDGKTNANLYLLYVGQRRDGSFFLDNYITANVSCSYRLCEHREFFVRIDNLFDEQYEQVRGYGVPGLTAYAGMRLYW